jgi:2',3'-cyclic-nucleotide 2'-phosphodiesterase
MPTIKILFFGDIFGKIGRQGVIKILPKLKKQYQPDLIIANVENLAHGRGLTKKTIEEMQAAGLDFFTSGNHVWDKHDGTEILEQEDSPLIRPANYPSGTAGRGEKILKVGQNNLLVVNLIGRVFFKEEYEDPFKTIDKILDQYHNEKFAGIIIDIHAEATSEKKALYYFLDGRVSAVLGTHTHIQTADEQISSQGTAFIADLGMTGPQDSVIGLDKDTIISNFISGTTQSAEVPEQGPCQINGVYLEINPQSAETVKIIRINEVVQIK